MEEAILAVERHQFDIDFGTRNVFPELFPQVRRVCFARIPNGQTFRT